MIEAGTRIVPTLTTMEGAARNLGNLNLTYDNARASVTALHRAGVALIAGTDAFPTAAVFTTNLSSWWKQDSPQRTLRCATGASDAFDLPARGSIAEGKRPDLLLVAGDPTSDITATRRIQHLDSWPTHRS